MGKFHGGGVYAGVPAKRIGAFDDVIEKRKMNSPELRKKTERFQEEWDNFKRKYGESE